MQELKRKIKVLIVDDSAIVRQTIKQILSDWPNIEVVGVAINPVFAAKKIQELNPDVLLLDIQMPQMDGLSFLRQLMRYRPIPTIIFSSFAPEGSLNALKAFEYGAVEVIEKPQLALPSDLKQYKTRLIQAIESAALAKLTPLSQTTEEIKLTPTSQPYPTENIELIALGASTGGPEAIRYILQNLSPNAPPVAIVQHMPPGFTKLFAQRLNELSELYVTEATSGITLQKGMAVVAPGDKHIIVQKLGNQLTVELSDEPPVNRHKPSVDVLFRSVAQNLGPNAVGIILTGMGADGVRGLSLMRQKGALTIAQDKQSSVVFGMPKVAINRNAAQIVLPLQQIPTFLNNLIEHQKLQQ